nr:MAG TPA: transmembrane protein [Caudoviricetes sp.]
MLLVYICLYLFIFIHIKSCQKVVKKSYSF